MVNLQFLANITPLQINTSVLGNVNTAVPNLIENANTVSLGFYGIGVWIAIFVYLLIRTSSQAGTLRFDTARSIMLSSGITFVFAFIMNISGLVTSYQQALWFFTVFVVSIIWVYYLKRQNL